MIRLPICTWCIYSLGDLKCKAFDRIPREILFGTHEKVVEGQKGDYVYTRNEKECERSKKIEIDEQD
ncbi:MAG: hypothetical protein RIS47_2317 [Bacteroidota bacterium]|jgi:hypothetical protein